ncbi:HD domain-containing protein [Spirochaetia bacterium 38H-sp]|uniref:HD domain-containing protein n=1 Tax=Rarispira pelagica TaxID=3141764 RepID=A0ABU9U8Z3_9SPIR
MFYSIRRICKWIEKSYIVLIMTKGQNQKAVAVLDIGSIALRLVIAELIPGKDFKILDRAVRNCALGKDVFENGFVSEPVFKAMRKILKDYKELLSSWGLKTQDVRAIATSALRDAENRDTIIDRIKIELGYNIEVVEGLEQNHLTYLAVDRALRNYPVFYESGSLVVESGGGSTDIIILDRGAMVSAHSLDLGTVRLLKQLPPRKRNNATIELLVKENISATKSFLKTDFKLADISTYIAVGGDARFMASIKGVQESPSFKAVEKDYFYDFLDEIEAMSLDRLVARFSLSYSDAEHLFPALLIHSHFLAETKADFIIVPEVSMREGALISMSMPDKKGIKHNFYRQIMDSARNLAKRYFCDMRHVEQVKKLACMLFDSVSVLHGLTEYERLILEVAALLHDVGRYINPALHELHGSYIIKNSELFGLSTLEIELIADVVSMHRGDFKTFSSRRADNVLLAKKLAAILRVADALDSGHVSKIMAISVDITEDEVVLFTEKEEELVTEKYALAQKSDLFKDVFARRIRLV